MKGRHLLLMIMLLPFTGIAQELIHLYPGEIPGSKACDTKEVVQYENNGDRISNVTDPTILAYIPKGAKGPIAAVIICPGGGYRRLAMNHEGYDVAKRFNEAGVAAFVLKYRLPNDECMVNKSSGPLQDAQQAIYLVRKNAAKWNIDADKVGIMGFSAGGHLASTAGTHFTNPVQPNAENISVRPDFQMLIYPVIDLSDSLAHMGSRINLIGKDATAADVVLFSNDRQVTAQTPPAFLVHAADDATVKAGNSIAFAEAMIRLKLPVEMHIYPHGGHGFGMLNKTTTADWFTEGLVWMRASGWIQ